MRLSTKICEVFSRRETRGKDVGVEIEVETDASLPSTDCFEDSLWKKVRDGSLRGGDNGEFVLRTPLSESKAIEAVEWLKRKLIISRSVVSDSVRAGVHIHLNCRSLTVKQLWTFVTCYYILEETLTDFCGEGRQGNHFCLRAMDADFVVTKVLEAISSDDLFCLMNNDLRYAALNFNALYKFGSLEFRQLRTPTDLSKVGDWIKILGTVKRNSLLYDNPQSVIENFSFGGEEGFFNAMLEGHQHLLEFNEHKLQRGIRVAQDIGYAREWD